MTNNLDKLPKVIYLMGPPGGGKGTQAQLLAEKVGYSRFSTGDAFREVSRQDSKLGRRVKETIDNGFLAPPEMAAEIVIAAVKKRIEAGEGLIFDGTPRTVEESKIVDDFFAEQGYGKPLIMYLAVDKNEMIRRNSIRKFCLGIAGDFPVMTGEDRERCEKAGGKIGTRPDDDPTKFATRWDEFMTRTYPVVEGYRQQGIVHEVDGMPSVEEVHVQIMEIVKKYQ
jgi:adenylate kinase